MGCRRCAAVEVGEGAIGLVVVVVMTKAMTSCCCCCCWTRRGGPVAVLHRRINGTPPPLPAPWPGYWFSCRGSRLETPLHGRRRAATARGVEGAQQVAPKLDRDASQSLVLTPRRRSRNDDGRGRLEGGKGATRGALLRSQGATRKRWEWLAGAAACCWALDRVVGRPPFETRALLLIQSSAAAAAATAPPSCRPQAALRSTEADANTTLKGRWSCGRRDLGSAGGVPLRRLRPPCTTWSAGARARCHHLCVSI